MEGVEDIPGSALHEGMKWDWETFPEYLDSLEKLPRTMDIAAQVPHGPLRLFRHDYAHVLGNVCRLWRNKGRMQSQCDSELFMGTPGHSLMASSRVRCVRKPRRSGISTQQSGARSMWRTVRAQRYS